MDIKFKTSLILATHANYILILINDVWTFKQIKVSPFFSTNQIYIYDTKSIIKEFFYSDNDIYIRPHNIRHDTII